MRPSSPSDRPSGCPTPWFSSTISSVALAGPQVLLSEQPEGVVTLGRDGGRGGLACRLVEQLPTLAGGWRLLAELVECRSGRPRRTPRQRPPRRPTHLTLVDATAAPTAGPLAAGLSATTTAATRTAATRCGTPIPGSVGVGTRRTAAHVSNPMLITITAQAIHATATIASRSSRPSSARPHAAGDRAPRSRGSACVRATSTTGTTATSNASAPSAASARPIRRGPVSPLVVGGAHGRTPLTEWTRATSALPRTVNWGTPIRPRNTVGTEVVVVTAIPLPPSMTRAEPSTPDARR